jgi:hypothetical protein
MTLSCKWLVDDYKNPRLVTGGRSMVIKAMPKVI